MGSCGSWRPVHPGWSVLAFGSSSAEDAWRSLVSLRSDRSQFAAQATWSRASGRTHVSFPALQSFSTGLADLTLNSALVTNLDKTSMMQKIKLKIPPYIP